MAANEKTFGGAISEARKAQGWALKDLASRGHRRRAPVFYVPADAPHRAHDILDDVRAGERTQSTHPSDLDFSKPWAKGVTSSTVCAAWGFRKWFTTAAAAAASQDFEEVPTTSMTL